MNFLVCSKIKDRKPYLCDICDDTFTIEHELKNNLLSVHGEKKPFKCDKPDVQSNCNLKNHISSIHERKKLAHAIFAISSC